MNQQNHYSSLEFWWVFVVAAEKRLLPPLPLCEQGSVAVTDMFSLSRLHSPSAWEQLGKTLHIAYTKTAQGTKMMQRDH